MKKLIYLASFSLLFACESAPTPNASESVNLEKDHIAVYDFHAEHRCKTCIAIEEATLSTLDKHFKSQLEEEVITFTLLNAEAQENQDIAEEYAAFGTTLAITVIKDGEKEIIDITNWAFDAIKGDDFESELTEKLNNALAQL